MTIKVGIAGVGAIGSAVAKELLSGIEGYTLEAISDPSPKIDTGADNVSFEELATRCDLVIECLPPAIVPAIALPVLSAGKDLIMASTSAAILHPAIMEIHQTSKGRLILPTGALAGLDGVKGMRGLGILSASITTTKKPAGYEDAPYVTAHNIDLKSIHEPTCIFRGNALEAAAGFPANVNVAATLSLAGIGPEKTQVEIWAAPHIKGNTHAIEVRSDYSVLRATIENTPDPANPKSSMLTAHSILRILRDQNAALVVL